MRLSALPLAVAIVVAVGATSAQQPRTIWDGVFTVAQAKQGETLYTDRCATCHGDTLGGMEAAPALTGTAFYTNWEGETLQALFDRMRVSMPPDKPGSLSRAQATDLLAHLLRSGGYPAGEMPLDAAADLSRITIRMYKPQE
jgi:mono/diheme cytochrome c family protein